MTFFLNLFRRIPFNSRATDQLHQARIDLLEGQANREHYDAMVPMLEKRIKRLESQLEDSDVTKNVTRINNRKGATNV